jgi:hypothetical protein
MNPPTEQFPEGTVTIRLHRRKPQHIIMDRRDVNLVLAEELEMQRTENRHLKKKHGEQARYIVELLAVIESLGGEFDTGTFRVVEEERTATRTSPVSAPERVYEEVAPDTFKDIT